LVERLRPNALSVDVRMPGLSGLDAIRHVYQRVPHTRVIVLSTSVNVTHVHAAVPPIRDWTNLKKS
jgi:DNA-binding NarL/FixJ family response regulator